MTTTSVHTRSVNRLVGFGGGAVYLLAGLVGFAVTSGVGFAHTHGKELIFLEVNPLHNIVHIAIGVVLGLAAYRGAAAATVANTLVGGTYLVVGILGLFLTDSSVNIIAVNHPDNVLHLLTAAVLLGVGLSKK
jgi:Domain of unknown function (DUF4383)